jgi:hypothetical protein
MAWREYSCLCYTGGEGGGFVIRPWILRARLWREERGKLVKAAGMTAGRWWGCWGCWGWGDPSCR